MATEIERKFLVRSDEWRDAVVSHSRVRQGYLAVSAKSTVRVRLEDEKGTLTIKGPSNGISRAEFEYSIPAADAEAMLRELLISRLIEKTRYLVRCGRHLWELDVFDGDNAGLVLAEVELASEDESFEMPAWAGLEVSADRRYYNASLARQPFKDW